MALLDTELSENDFNEIKTDKILSLKGTYPDFELKDFCPAVFRNILELQNIEHSHYMQLICGDEHFMHFVSSGKIGSVFVSSLDARFVMKILRKSELKAMLEMLPNYYRHLQTYRASILSKLYGLHVISLFGGVEAYFSVMSNEIKSSFQVHRCYDLKGTTKGRNNATIIAENCSVLKDVNFDFCFYLDPFVRHRLLKQIKYDCEFLEAEGIMDYSFLLSVHIEGYHEGLLNCKSSISSRTSISSRCSTSGRSSSSGSSYSKMDTLDDFTDGSLGLELSLSYSCPPPEGNFDKFGKEMPARAKKTQKNGNGEAVSLHKIWADEYFGVILNFGIVDIFQTYNMSKRIEHVYKSFQYDSKSITAVNPKAYSRRFQDFLSRAFQPEDFKTMHSRAGSMSSDISSRQCELASDL